MRENYRNQNAPMSLFFAYKFVNHGLFVKNASCSNTFLEELGPHNHQFFDVVFVVILVGVDIFVLHALIYVVAAIGVALSFFLVVRNWLLLLICCRCFLLLFVAASCCLLFVVWCLLTCLLVCCWIASLCNHSSLFASFTLCISICCYYHSSFCWAYCCCCCCYFISLFAFLPVAFLAVVVLLFQQLIHKRHCLAEIWGVFPRMLNQQELGKHWLLEHG